MASVFVFLILITAAEESIACSVPRDDICSMDGDKTFRTCDGHMENGATSCEKLESDYGCNCRGYVY